MNLVITIPGFTAGNHGKHLSSDASEAQTLCSPVLAHPVCEEASRTG